MTRTVNSDREGGRLERLEAAIDSHGGDLTLWPAAARAEAEALAAESAAARRLLEEAKALEAALAREADALRDLTPSPIKDALAARLFADADAFCASAPKPEPRRDGALAEMWAALRREISDFGAGLAAGLGGAAAAAGLAVGVFATGAFVATENGLSETAASSLFDVAAIVESDYDGVSEGFDFDPEAGS